MNVLEKALEGRNFKKLEFNSVVNYIGLQEMFVVCDISYSQFDKKYPDGIALSGYVYA